MSYYIITFESTGDAIKAENLLKESFSARIIPVPSEISAGCGFAIRLESDQLEQIKATFEKKVVFSGYYLVVMQDGKKNITAIC